VLSREDYENSVHRLLVAGEDAADEILDSRQQAQMQTWRRSTLGECTCGSAFGRNELITSEANETTIRELSG